MGSLISRSLLAGCSLFATHAACAQPNMGVDLAARVQAADGRSTQDPNVITTDPTSQTAASEPADTPAQAEITVTARRRTEALQDTPISVSALSGEQLERSGVTDVQALQYRTPSLSITSSQSQRNTVAFSLRGQRTQETQLFSDPPVGTYFAEVVQPRPYGFGQSLYDLESVQVLKGVQGTLFGRNMTGGAILVEPRHPRLGIFEGEVRAQYGKYDLRDLFGVVNVPLGDVAAIRVAGKTRERDGWAREVTSGLRYDNQNYDSFRVSALIEPAANIESLTVFDWFDLDENGTASFLTAVRFPSVLTNYENLRRAGFIDANAIPRGPSFAASWFPNQHRCRRREQP
jgi:iron complex outermembrane recepter protein